MDRFLGRSLRNRQSRKRKQLKSSCVSGTLELIHLEHSNDPDSSNQIKKYGGQNKNLQKEKGKCNDEVAMVTRAKRKSVINSRDEYVHNVDVPILRKKAKVRNESDENKPLNLFPVTGSGIHENVDNITDIGEDFQDKEDHVMIKSDNSISNEPSGEFDVLKSGQNIGISHTCSVCNKNCSSVGSLKMHILTHTEEIPFLCSVCGKGFKRGDRLQYHVSVVHRGEKPFSCNICDKTFTFKHNLAAHMNYHLPETRFSCSLCNKNFKYRGDLNKHMKRKHKESIEFGKNCVKLNQVDTPFEESQTDETNIDGFEAVKIEIDVAEDGLAYQMNVADGANSVRPDIDNVEFDNTSNSGKLYQCTMCNERFELKYSLDHHLLTHPKDRSYHCSLCDKVFKRKNRLHNHVSAIHYGERPFTCDICSKTFTLKYNLVAHMNYHFYKARFSCSLCKKNFKYRGDLNKHMTRKHKESIEFGKNCVKLEQFDGPPEESRRQTDETEGTERDAVPIINADIENHEEENKKNDLGGFAYKMKISADNYVSQEVGKAELEINTKGKKLHQCTTCGKKFAIKCRFKRHLLTHSNIKPHHCSLCDKGFIRRDALQVHIYAAHTGYRPFSCKICSKTFTTENHYNMHVLSHSAERPFLCKYCNKSFKTKACTRKHVKRIHSSGLHGDAKAVTSETKYCCYVCKRRFGCEAELKNHGKTCIDKRYICVVCNKDYIGFKNFQQHEEKHREEDETVYKCLNCGEEMRGYDEIKNHAGVCSKTS